MLPGGRAADMAILVVGCSLIGLPSCRQRTKSPTERGQGTFLRACAGCHGPDARGTHPPGFAVPPRDLTDPDLQGRMDDAALRETIHYGKGQMPPFGAALPYAEVTDLLSYVRSLRRPAP
jgi:mono/diheme cytochrome c family protein